ncbi:MAG: hypothetical protein R2724_34050 [Bryobacterales bacterium]
MRPSASIKNPVPDSAAGYGSKNQLRCNTVDVIETVAGRALL